LGGHDMQHYIEMTVEEARKLYGNNATVLVSVKSLEDDDVDVVFVRKSSKECDKLFDDAKTVASIMDDFIKQISIFTEKQDLMNIIPHGKQKIIFLKD
jgi:hypothetical protein